MTPHASTIAAYLRSTLSEVCRSNPQYSQRAFARKLGISPGGLSQVLSGRKGVSPARAHEIARALGLEGREKEYFLLLAQIDAARTPAHRADLHELLAQAFPERAPARNLAVDHFRMISEWYGLPVLELVSTFGAEWSSTEMSIALGVTRPEIDAMLDRLVRLELIEKLDGGGYRKLTDRVLVESHVPSDAIRSYYEGVLERARASIRSQGPAEKVAGSEVFAFDPTDLEEVRAATDEYLNRLVSIARKGKSRTALYQAFVDVFRLTPVPAGTAAAPKPEKRKKV